jgi:hypothetical protein
MKNTLHLWFIKGKKISNVSNLARSSPYHVTSLIMQPLNYAYRIQILKRPAWQLHHYHSYIQLFHGKRARKAAGNRSKKLMNLLAIPSILSRSYSTFPLCSGTTLIVACVQAV